MEINEAFAVVSGEYESYMICNVFSKEVAAETFARRMNAAVSFEDYRVETIPFNVEVPEGYTLGVCGTYSYLNHGFDVDVANVVFEEALYSDGGVMTGYWNTSWSAYAESESECLEKLKVFAARMASSK